MMVISKIIEVIVDAERILLDISIPAAA